MIPATLADYVPRLREADDDIWRVRIVCHEFGLRWEDTPLYQRLGLVELEPEPISAAWDAFLAAYVEHRCYHDRLAAPAWVFNERRYLDGYWFPFPAKWEAFRVEAMEHAPAAFEAHGTLIAERDLMVV